MSSSDARGALYGTLGGDPRQSLPMQPPLNVPGYANSLASMYMGLGQAPPGLSLPPNMPLGGSAVPDGSFAVTLPQVQEAPADQHQHHQQ